VTYFELFGLNPSFDIDLNQLKSTYRQLQQQHHPDLAADQDAALAQSSTINQAYQTLQYVDSRAAYLLELKKENYGLENSIGDIEFLQHALELREQLDEATTPAQLSSLRIELQQWLESLSREFKIDYSEEDWAEARDTTRKLRFMQKIIADVDKAEDRFDDDLDASFDDDF
jgi:molecular chaperone HscB